MLNTHQGRRRSIGSLGGSNAFGSCFRCYKVCLKSLSPRQATREDYPRIPYPWSPNRRHNKRCFNALRMRQSSRGQKCRSNFRERWVTRSMPHPAVVHRAGNVTSGGRKPYAAWERSGVTVLDQGVDHSEQLLCFLVSNLGATFNAIGAWSAGNAWSEYVQDKAHQ